MKKSSHTVVILDYMANHVSMFKTPEVEDVDTYLYELGYDMDNIYYMSDPNGITLEL